MAVCGVVWLAGVVLAGVLAIVELAGWLRWQAVNDTLIANNGRAIVILGVVKSRVALRCHRQVIVMLLPLLLICLKSKNYTIDCANFLVTD